LALYFYRQVLPEFKADSPAATQIIICLPLSLTGTKDSIATAALKLLSRAWLIRNSGDA
jgi:hypothetical protein